MTNKENEYINYVSDSYDAIFAIIGDLHQYLDEYNNEDDEEQSHRAAWLEILPHAIQIWLQFEKWKTDNGV